MSAPDSSPKPVSPLDEALDAMAAQMRQLHSRRDAGTLAALRRLDPVLPVSPVFHALLANAAPDHLFAYEASQDEMMRRFARVAQIFAMKPEGLSRRPLGAVLHAIGLSQQRLGHLLNARGAILGDILRRIARRIAVSPEPIPYRELGRLLLLPSGSGAHASLALKIARDFQRAARSAASTRE